MCDLSEVKGCTIKVSWRTRKRPLVFRNDNITPSAPPPHTHTNSFIHVLSCNYFFRIYDFCLKSRGAPTFSVFTSNHLQDQGLPYCPQGCIILRGVSLLSIADRQIRVEPGQSPGQLVSDPPTQTQEKQPGFQK